MKNLYGVVVIYNPENEVIKNIRTYLSYLKKLYVVDNSETMNESCIKNICRLSDKIEYKFLNCNMGIAYPINLVIKKLEKDDWLLTMDQDSYFYRDSFLEYIKILPELKENVYAITPEIIYKNIFDLNNIKKIQLKKSRNVFSLELYFL
ncbi:glycosyltransferase [Megamonas sp.]